MIARCADCYGALVDLGTAMHCPKCRPPIVFLPLMTKPAREVEKGTKYLPEVWKPND